MLHSSSAGSAHLGALSHYDHSQSIYREPYMYRSTLGLYSDILRYPITVHQSETTRDIGCCCWVSSQGFRHASHDVDFMLLEGTPFLRQRDTLNPYIQILRSSSCICKQYWQYWCVMELAVKYFNNDTDRGVS